MLTSLSLPPFFFEECRAPLSKHATSNFASVRCSEKSSFSSVSPVGDGGVAAVHRSTGRPGITVNRLLTASSRGERRGWG